jgi:hypothetical protein
MIHFRRFCIIIAFVSITFSAFAQNGDMVSTSGGVVLTSGDLVLNPGDLAMAEKYVQWAADSIKQERWLEAETALERAADFANESSDVSYLLALCRHHLNRPRGAVLHALDIALKTDRWTHYEKSSAFLLQAETYLALKRYSFVIASVNFALPQSPDTMLLHLRALKYLGDLPAFLRLMTQALNIYEHDPRFVSLLFESVDEQIPQLNERTLIDTALRRLPLLVEKDPSLSYKAVPFLRNIEDSRRLLQNYRAENAIHPESLPLSLKIGVIDEKTMMNDFFSYRTNQYSVKNQSENLLYLHLIRELWDLLRNNEYKNDFIRNLLAFSGVVIEDSDNDSYPESFTRYKNGKIDFFNYDEDQDWLSELTLHFYADNDLPQTAEFETMDDDSEFLNISAYHVKDEDRGKVYLEYFTYPSVKAARLGETKYFPVYREFHVAPIDVVPIVDEKWEGGEMPLYPKIVSSVSRLTKRSLISFANIIKRPSREFPEAIEEIHLTNSVVNRAREVLPDGSIISEMFFERGEPYMQYVDLDFDGKQETRRQFLREGQDFPGIDPTDYNPVLELLESDFNGDDFYEYGELYLPDGRIERSWDNDGDGIRETKEVKPNV